MKLNLKGDYSDLVGVDLKKPSGELVKGIKRGADQVQQMGAGLAATIGSAAGSEMLENQGMREYHRQADQMRDNQARVNTAEEIGSAGDLVDFGIGKIGEMIPQIATMTLSGGAAGLAVKQAAKQGIAKRVAAGMSEKQAAEAFAKTVAAKYGAKGAAGATNVGMMTGGVGGSMHDQTGEIHAGKALAAGTISGAIDSLPIFAAFDKLKGTGVGGSVLNRAKNILGDTASMSLKEGGTEILQSAVEQAAVEAIKSDIDNWTTDDISQFKNMFADWKTAGLAGMFGGGAMGGGASAVSNTLGALKEQGNEPVDPDADELLAAAGLADVSGRSDKLAEPENPYGALNDVADQELADKIGVNQDSAAGLADYAGGDPRQAEIAGDPLAAQNYVDDQNQAYQTDRDRDRAAQPGQLGWDGAIKQSRNKADDTGYSPSGRSDERGYAKEGALEGDFLGRDQSENPQIGRVGNEYEGEVLRDRLGQDDPVADPSRIGQDPAALEGELLDRDTSIGRDKAALEHDDYIEGEIVDYGPAGKLDVSPKQIESVGTEVVSKDIARIEHKLDAQIKNLEADLKAATTPFTRTVAKQKVLQLTHQKEQLEDQKEAVERTELQFDQERKWLDEFQSLQTGLQASVPPKKDAEGKEKPPVMAPIRQQDVIREDSKLATKDQKRIAKAYRDMQRAGLPPEAWQGVVDGLPETVSGSKIASEIEHKANALTGASNKPKPQKAEPEDDEERNELGQTAEEYAADAIGEDLSDFHETGYRKEEAADENELPDNEEIADALGEEVESDKGDSAEDLEQKTLDILNADNTPEKQRLVSAMIDTLLKNEDLTETHFHESLDKEFPDIDHEYMARSEMIAAIANSYGSVEQGKEYRTLGHTRETWERSLNNETGIWDMPALRQMYKNKNKPYKGLKREQMVAELVNDRFPSRWKDGKMLVPEFNSAEHQIRLENIWSGETHNRPGTKPEPEDKPAAEAKPAAEMSFEELQQYAKDNDLKLNPPRSKTNYAKQVKEAQRLAGKKKPVESEAQSPKSTRDWQDAAIAYLDGGSMGKGKRPTQKEIDSVTDDEIRAFGGTIAQNMEADYPGLVDKIKSENLIDEFMTPKGRSRILAELQSKAKPEKKQSKLDLPSLNKKVDAAVEKGDAGELTNILRANENLYTKGVISESDYKTAENIVNAAKRRVAREPEPKPEVKEEPKPEATADGHSEQYGNYREHILKNPHVSVNLFEHVMTDERLNNGEALELMQEYIKKYPDAFVRDSDLEKFNRRMEQAARWKSEKEAEGKPKKPTKATDADLHHLFGGDRAKYVKMKVGELRELAKQRGISHTGTKTKLIDRLENADNEQRVGDDSAEGVRERPELSTQHSNAQGDSAKLETEQAENAKGSQEKGNTDASGKGGAADVLEGTDGTRKDTGASGSKAASESLADAGTRVTRRPDFHIDDPKIIQGGGQVQRFNKNTDAIELYQEVAATGREPTADELQTIASYTGWGSFGQELFQGSWNNPQPKEGWEKRDNWLREHLGQSEWESAQRSIINAHYTDPPTVQAMWGMLERMGFGGGRVLEPSLGIGNFVGMAPKGIKSRSDFTGIELDELTGGMAKILYPNANIQIKGYEKSQTPDGFYDVVIGNWPFANVKVPDRRYRKVNPSLHDYFFLKALDQTREGGIVIGITSASTMDKKNNSVRREMARKSELVASFRLPSGAFKEYAGTSVVTDIVILKKRAPKQLPNDSWINTGMQSTPSGTDVEINQYYIDNPQNIIGTLDFGHGTTTFREGMIVKRPEDMEAQLQKIVGMVAENTYTPENRTKHITYKTNQTQDRVGALIDTKDGLFISQGEQMMNANEFIKYAVKSEKATQKREADLKSLINLRKLYGKLLETDSDADRKALNDAYKKHTKDHKALSDSFGLNYLKRIKDPFYDSLAALENDDGSPAKILSESTFRVKPSITKPTVSDAFVLSRIDNVSPSLDQVAKVANKPKDQVKAELMKSGAVFETATGDIIPKDVYLSGNVRLKLAQAKEAGLTENVKALEDALPPDIPYHEIEVKFGATWVPNKYYGEFVGHLLNIDPDEVQSKFRLGRWKIKLPSGVNSKSEATTGYGTKEYKFHHLINAAISNTRPTIKGRDADGNTFVKHEATKEVAAKIEEIRNHFSEWIWESPERRIELETEYNELRNAYANPEYDGGFMPLEGMALTLGDTPFNLRKHQADAIWRAVVNRKSLNAHEVGTGKSFTIAGIAIESRRYGIAKKPLIFAHNANSKSVAADINVMYPGAKVLYVDNLSKKDIKRRMHQIANDDWDAVVMPHSLIDRLGMKEETLMAMAQEEIDELEAEAQEAASDDGVQITPEMWDNEDEVKKLRSPTAKELVKARQRILAKVQDMSEKASREDAIAFEDLGVDMVMVDESHEFKKPPIATRMRMKGLQTQTSSKSISLQYLTRHVRSQNNGANVHLFTGTPITNTLVEIFHQMKYIMEEDMKEQGIDSWDGWFGSFAGEVEDVELNSGGEYEAVTRLAQFVNIPELRRMLGQYMDVVFSEDMPEFKPRKTKSGKTMADKLTPAEENELLNGRTEGAKDKPYKKVVNVNTDMTPDQIEIFNEVQEASRSFKRMTGKEKMEVMREGALESPIIHENVANRASFDSRLANAEENAGKEGQLPPHEQSKPALLTNKIAEIYESDPNANQVVFMERGISQDGVQKGRKFKQFSTAKDLIELFVQKGIPREKIALVTGATSKDKRKEIADKMNSSEIRVVIGNRSTLGVGVNMQKNLRAMHHMDAPWMPGDLEQANGRGDRQGNQWNTVLEFRYLTDRLDGRRWQVLTIKDKFTKQFMKSDGSQRVIEGDAVTDDESDLLESFSEAVGDPRLLMVEKKKRDLEKYQRKERVYSRSVAEATQSAKDLVHKSTNLKSYIGRLKEEQPIYQKALESIKDEFKATVNGKTYKERKDFNKALEVFVTDNVREGKGEVNVGEYAGIEIVAEHRQHQHNPIIKIGNSFTANVGYQSIESAMRNRANYKEGAKLETRLEEYGQSHQRATEVSKSKFAHADSMKQTEQDIKDIRKDMELNPAAPPAWLRTGAPVGADVFHNGKKFEVTGHRWTEENWYVLAKDEKGATTIPYTDATDKQGIPVYEERKFESPIAEKLDNSDKVPANEDGDWTKAAIVPTRDGVEAVEVPKRKVRTPNPGTTANAKKYQAAADKIKGVKVNVVDSHTDLPYDATASDVGGVYDGQVYVNAAQIQSPLDFNKTIIHEVVGHMGVESVLGDNWDAVKADIDAMPLIDDLKQQVRDNYPESEYYGEIMARLAERRATDNQVKQLFRKLKSLVSRALREMGVSGRIPGVEVDAAIDAALTADIKASSGLKKKINLGEIGQSKQVNGLKDTASAIKQGFNRHKLAVLNRRQLVDNFKEILPRAKEYLAAAENAEALKSKWQIRAGEAGERAAKFERKNKEGFRKLADVIHNSTIVGVNPADYKPIEIAKIEATIKKLTAKLNLSLSPDETVELKELNKELDTAIREYAIAEKSAAAKSRVTSKGNYRYFKPADRTKVDRLEKRISELKGKARESITPTEKMRLEYLKHIRDNHEFRESQQQQVRDDYNALPTEAQEIFKDFSKYHEDMFDAQTEAIIERINQSQAKTEDKLAEIEGIRSVREDMKLSGVYHPLSRFGEYAAMVKWPDGQTEFRKFETKHSMDIWVENAEKKGALIESAEKVKEESREISDKLPEALRDSLLEMVNDMAEDNKDLLAMKGEIHQMYLKSLPQLSARKHEIRRGNVLGYDDDALKSFSHTAMHGAAHLSRIKHGWQMSDALTSMEAEVRIAGNKPIKERYEKSVRDIQDAIDQGVPQPEMLEVFQEMRDKSESETSIEFYTNLLRQARSGKDLEQLKAEQEKLLENAEKIKGKDVVRARDAVSEINRSYEWTMAPQTAPWASKASGFIFLNLLAVTPAAAILNLSQMALVTFPALGAKYGNRKVAAALAKAQVDFVGDSVKGRKLGFDESKLSKDEIAALNSLEERGTFSRTLSNELAGLADEGIDTNSTYAKVMKAASWTFAATERNNREINSLVAYRLSRGAGKTHEQALQEAHDSTQDTQFDYSNSARARLLTGDIQRVALTYKSYSFSYAYVWYSNFKKAIGKAGVSPEEQAEAKKMFTSMLGMQFAVSGLLGLPMARLAGNILEQVVNLFLDDEDEIDYEEWSRSFLSDMLGNKMSTAIMKGPWDSIPGNPFSGISDRTSASSLFYSEGMTTDEMGEDAYYNAVDNLLGPAGGMIKGYAKAAQDIGNGDVWKGTERAVPKLFRDLSKAVRYWHADGVENKHGDTVYDPSGMDLFRQAMGFTPAGVTEAYKRNSFIYGRDKQLKDVRSKIMRLNNMSIQKNDPDGQKKAREMAARFNKKYPELAIKEKNFKNSYKRFKQARDNAVAGIDARTKTQKQAVKDVAY